MTSATRKAIHWAEQGLVPDTAIRAGIRRLLKTRLEEIHADHVELAAEAGQRFAMSLQQAPIALVPEKANQQHYEVPPEFFAQALGPHRKYSSCWWPAGVTSLEDAEAAALEASCVRAGLTNGQEILELGCGWGSLTLWMASHYPLSRITAVSNSHAQRTFIEAEASRRELRNIRVVTADMNRFDAQQRFDRVVSIEMFEHMRNWPVLFARVRRWLRPDGLFFMHVFVHRMTPYAFVEQNEDDWMSRYFFSGGMMPSDDLALRFQDDLRIRQVWRWDGTHYERTANAWLANMDAHREAIRPILDRTYGADHASQWWMRWRIFFMSCAELFGYDHGRQWWVTHYLFEPRR